MTTTYTRVLRLAKPDFRDPGWGNTINDNLDAIDGVIQTLFAGTNFVNWANNTIWQTGQVAVDLDTSPPTYWICSIAHTSAPAPLTFSQERIANPTYWSPFLAVPQRIKLTANLIMWVRSDGNDNNDGLSNTVGGAKLTWNALYAAAINNYDFGGFTVTLISGTQNTYPRGLFMASSWVGGGSLVVDLNGCSIAETVTKGIIQNSIQPGLVTIQNSAGLGVGGVISSLNFSGIQLSAPGQMAVGAGITMGACGDAAFESIQGGTLSLSSPVNISGAGGRELVICAGGSFGFNGETVNFLNNVTYSDATVSSTLGSSLIANGVTFNLNGHTVTGSRYYVDQGSSLYTGNAGENYFPGTTVGTKQSGGIYDNVVASGIFSANASFASNWQMDASGGAPIVVAASGNSGALPTGSGLVVIADLTTTGQTALFFLGNSSATKLTGGTNWSATTTPGAGSFGMAWSGTDYRIYNGSGAIRTFSIGGFRGSPNN